MTDIAWTNKFTVREYLRGRSSTAFSAFLIALTLTLSVALVQGAKPFYYDSGEYWHLGTTFTVHGHFSLLNIDSAMRGYLWPLFDHLLHLLGSCLSASDSLAVRLFNVVMIALLGAVLAPRLAEIVWPQTHWGLGRRTALVGLLLVFWSGYLPFPLSDLPALALALTTLVALARPGSAWWSALAGAACGAAIDMRPSYLLLAPAALAILGWNWQQQRPRASIWRGVLCMSALLGSFALVSLPQSLASQRHFATWSFIPGTAAHLTTF